MNVIIVSDPSIALLFLLHLPTLNVFHIFHTRLECNNALQLTVRINIWRYLRTRDASSSVEVGGALSNRSSATHL